MTKDVTMWRTQHNGSRLASPGVRFGTRLRIGRHLVCHGRCIGLVLVLAMWFIALPAHGKGADPAEGDSAVNSKGYDRASTYLSIDGAEIDAFNFNFVTQFPVAVGLTYPENAGLSLRVNLVYNSRVTHAQNVPIHRTALRVRRQNPFGLGFDLSLGRIVTTFAKGGIGPYAYVDSSGASHKLGPIASGSIEYRTHDGSHLRAVLNGGSWTVSFPDGTVQLLGHQVGGPTLNDFHFGDERDGCNPEDGGTIPNGLPCPESFVVPDGTPPWLGWDRDFVGWHVTAVYSRAAVSPTPPSYTVEYFGDDGNANDAPFAHIIKAIMDQHGRTIQFEIDRARGVVTRVTVPAPATETGSPRTADYLLDYETRTITAGVVVQVLTRLSAPNVASVGEGRYVHDYGYDNGRLSLVRYPSGRAVKIAYQNYSYRDRSPNACDPFRLWSGSTGVNLIEKFLDGNTANTAPANYRAASFSQSQAVRDWIPQGVTCGYFRYDQVHTMIDPAGNKTEFKYRTPEAPGTEEEWYGLLLSERYFGGTGGTVLKTLEYDYVERDHFEWTPKIEDYEMVQKQVKTLWSDDTDENGNPLSNATQMVEDRSDFDSFGHYQRAELSGSAIGAEGKVIIKDYASDNEQAIGVLCPNLSTLRDNWLGNVVAREEVFKKVGTTETTVSRADYGYDQVRGLRTSAVERSTAGPTFDPCTTAPIASPGDAVTEYRPTSAGDLLSERHYVEGLTSPNLPTEVTTTYTYRFGARESTTQSGLTYYDSFRIIDPGSGLVTTERVHPTSPSDTSAESTTFAYDVLGRTTKINHGTDDPVVIVYENDPAAPAPAVRLARVRSTQGTYIAQTEAVDYFVQGRLDHEEKLNPDGSRAYRYTSYNNSDRVSSITEWTRQSSSSGVPGTTSDYAVKNATGTYLFEEPFGRPMTVTDALGGVTTYRYFGLNKEVTIRGVALKATALDDPADVRTRYYTDALGRLRVVSAPEVISQGAGHGPYEATGAGGRYTFDVLGRMLQADISGTVTLAPTTTDRYNASATSPQTRSFAYDSLGRSTQTTTPEAGTVTNLAWNALGQVTETQDAIGLAWGHWPSPEFVDTI